MATCTNLDAFTLHEPKVKFVLDQIPQDSKVCILSVVGAFRTGKSFLLDMFLRYLRHYDEHPDGACAACSHTRSGARLLTFSILPSYFTGSPPPPPLHPHTMARTHFYISLFFRRQLS